MEGPGLAYVAFSQAITLFPGSSFWAIIFFMSLVIMGLGTMTTLLEGIALSLQKSISTLEKHPKLVPGRKTLSVPYNLPHTHPRYCSIHMDPQLTNPNEA